MINILDFEMEGLSFAGGPSESQTPQFLAVLPASARPFRVGQNEDPEPDAMTSEETVYRASVSPLHIHA